MWDEPFEEGGAFDDGVDEATASSKTVIDDEAISSRSTTAVAVAAAATTATFKPAMADNVKLVRDADAAPDVRIEDVAFGFRVASSTIKPPPPPPPPLKSLSKLGISVNPLLLSERPEETGGGGKEVGGGGGITPK